MLLPVMQDGRSSGIVMVDSEAVYLETQAIPDFESC